MPDQVTTTVDVLRRQFDPTFQMLTDVVETCPEAVWETPLSGNPFWQHVLHALIGVQFWFRETGESFSPPDFGTGPVPDLDKVPTFHVDRETAKGYVATIRSRVDVFFGSLDDRRLLETSTIYDKCTYADLILMQVRHIQHHVGYCNGLLRSSRAPTVRWLGYAE